MVLIIFSILVLFANALGQEICGTDFPLETDFSQEDCPEETYYFHEGLNEANLCYPYCSKVSTANCPATVPCPLGHFCNLGNGKCEVDEKSCLKFYYADKWKDALLKPICEKDGTYKAVQCKGEEANGRCFCYDKIGNKIFGQEWSNKAQNMTCACSRKRAELLLDPTVTFVSLHCDRRGSFEPLQCQSGQCWCVEPLTGDLISPVVPEKAMEFLPCYERDQVGDKYLRQCESYAYANAMITKEFLIHGTKDANLQNVICDADGAYGPIQVERENAYCTWRDNSKIGSWQANIAERKTMNCNCARDTKYYEESGRTMHLSCINNGNYKYYQQTQDGQYYCVDQDGFKKDVNYVNNAPTEDDCNKYRSF